MAISTQRKIAIGRALMSLVDDVRRDVLSLVAQYRDADLRLRESLMKQAVDTPHRARAQLQAWMSAYDASQTPGAAQALLVECLAAAGSTETLAQINTELAALETQALTLVGRVTNDDWTWDQVAAAIEAAIGWEDVADLSYTQLPIPANYTTVWGEKW